MTQGVPDTGREVGLMYSFSSQSDGDFSALDTAGKDLTRQRKPKHGGVVGAVCKRTAEHLACLTTSQIVTTLPLAPKMVLRSGLSICAFQIEFWLY